MFEIRRSELASRTGCNPETIRFYESKGVLPEPARTAAGHRIYGPGDVQRLTFILQTRALGFSLAEVLELISLEEQPENCSDVYTLLSKHLSNVEKRLENLNSIKVSLKSAIVGCQNNVDVRCQFVGLKESLT